MNDAKRKELKDISWLVDEPTYRADSALSYSTLSRFSREGFDKLKDLFSPISTPSLTFGSLVDCIMTDGKEEFEKRFHISNIPAISDNLSQIADTLYNRFSSKYHDFNEIPDAILSEVGVECNYYKNNNYTSTRIKNIKSGCKSYYNMMVANNGRTIISKELFNEAKNTVSALKNSEVTKFFFADNNPFNTDIVRYYQLKFKAKLDGIDYRCMADLIVVDYKNKKIYPVDLKTSGHKEWDFYKSFIQWKYDIQARLYWRIIRDNLDRDPYFKDFELDDYRFIVVNKYSLTPLVWKYEDTTALGDMTYGKNHDIICKDPYSIGSELKVYLSNDFKTPIGIYMNRSNSIREWLNND